MDLLKGERIMSVLGNPVAVLKRCRSNSKQNPDKEAAQKVGRMVQKHGFSLQNLMPVGTPASAGHQENDGVNAVKRITSLARHNREDRLESSADDDEFGHAVTRTKSANKRGVGNDKGEDEHEVMQKHASQTGRRKKRARR